MKIHIKNKLYISDNLPPEMLKEIERDLTFKNPVYNSLVKMGKWTGRTEEFISILDYDAVKRELALPRGYYKNLCSILKKYDILPEPVNEMLILPKIQIESKITLRDYQIEPVNAISKRSQGGLIAVCGAGKTNMAIELMCRVKQPTLWICHTKELLNQTIDRMLATTTLTKEEIGIISDGKVNILSKVTIGLIGTLCKRDITEIQSNFGCVILDEAHHMPANTFYDVITQFDAKYRYYVTATPVREDGLTDILTYEMGEVAATITLEDIKDSIIIPTLEIVKTEFESNTDTYSDLIKELCNDNQRNKLLSDKIISEHNKGKYILVLSDRVEHCETLKELCRIPDSVILTGTTKTKERKKIMSAMQERRYKVLFATKLAREGLDIPHLDCLILATPKRAKGAVTQEVGRIMRTCEGKTTAKVIDFYDANVGILKGQMYKRREAYREMKIK